MAGAITESSRLALRRHGFDTLESFHSVMNYEKVDDIKHLRLPDVLIPIQAFVGFFIHRLEGHEKGVNLGGWEPGDLEAFIDERRHPIWMFRDRPLPDSPDVPIQGVYPTHYRALTDFYLAWEAFVPIRDFELLRDQHGVACPHDLAELESDLNKGTLLGVSRSCQRTLGRVLTWCRLNDVWLTEFDVNVHKPLICDALLKQELLRDGVMVAARSG